MARSPEESAALFERFPDRGGRTPRKVFFECLSDDERVIIEARGYEAVVLMAMPRQTAHDHQEYLFGLLQGMTDGTIQFDKQRIDAAELELRARHMLNKDSALSRASNRDDAVLAEVWNWESSHHTLQGNTTFTNPDEIQSFVASQREKRFGKPQNIERAAKRLKKKDKKGGA